MRNFILIVIFYFIQLLPGRAQTVSAIYQSTVRPENTAPAMSFFQVVDNGNSSLGFRVDSLQSLEAFVNAIRKNLGFFRKKQPVDSLFCSGFIFNRSLFILETDLADRMRWELEDTSAVIMGKRCLGASVNFRGRKWLAFYAPDVVSDAGPLKFHGLPGLIMSLRTDDGKYEYLISRLEVIDRRIALPNPYEQPRQEFVSYSFYRNLYIKKALEYQNKKQSEEKDGYELKFSVELMERTD